MIIDTSALIAILFSESEAKPFYEKIVSARICLLGAPTYFEATMVVISREGVDAVADLDELIERLGINVLAFNRDHMLAARQAFVRYGKGQGHPAQLNFGDCMAFAISKVEAMPLLFKGDDFSKTDVERVV